VREGDTSKQIERQLRKRVAIALAYARASANDDKSVRVPLTYKSRVYYI
jgi:hypothetical protein